MMGLEKWDQRDRMDKTNRTKEERFVWHGEERVLVHLALETC